MSKIHSFLQSDRFFKSVITLNYVFVGVCLIAISVMFFLKGLTFLG